MTLPERMQEFERLLTARDDARDDWDSTAAELGNQAPAVFTAEGQFNKADAALSAFVEPLLKDGMRLDWMQAGCDRSSTTLYRHAWDVTPDGDATHFMPLHDHPTHIYDVRAAIDSASSHEG